MWHMALSIVAIGLVGLGNGFQGNGMALVGTVAWLNSSMSGLCHVGSEFKNVLLNPHYMAGLQSNGASEFLAGVYIAIRLFLFN
jgi:hypothetical protein